MFVETSTATEIALVGVEALWKHRSILSGRLRKLRSYIKHGHVRIAVFGLGGTGKTTLGDLLSGQYTPGSKAKAYKLSLKTEEVTPKGDFVSTLFIPGGQDRNISGDWPALYQSLASGKTRGVVNVVAWGHHSFTDISYKETKYFKNLPKNSPSRASKEAFVRYYLETKRKEELFQAQELLPYLKTAKNKVWMVTLVTKQDLWWKERTQASDFYKSGEYGSLIKELTAFRGHERFRHEYVSAALVLNNLQTNDGEVLVPTAEGYDQNIQYANLAQLVEVIHTFIST
jgi:hypothetical protein